MKKVLLALTLLPAIAFANCDSVVNSHWVAKTDNSIHKFSFEKNNRVSFSNISKAEAYMPPDLVNANEFYGTTNYYQFDCNVIIELPHESGNTSQVYVYIAGDKGYGYYIENGKDKVVELSK